MNQGTDYLRDGRELETFINSTLDDLIQNPVSEHTSSIATKNPEPVCLFKISIKLALRNVIKKLISHDQKPGIVSSCIFCLCDKATIINVCKCGLESVCYQCFIKRNSEEILQHATPSIIDKMTNRICEVKLLEIVMVINCQVCGDISPLKSSIDKYILAYDTDKIESCDILHDIDYYTLQNKQLFEHISNFDIHHDPRHALSSPEHIKLDIGFTEFGYALEIIPDPDSLLIIKLNTATQDLILRYVQHKGDLNFTNGEIKIKIQKMQYFVLDAIYYKCVAFGLKYLEKMKQVMIEKDITVDTEILSQYPGTGVDGTVDTEILSQGKEQLYKSRMSRVCSIFLIKWNRLCCSINYIINIYMDGDCSRSYASSMVFLDILKSIET